MTTALDRIIEYKVDEVAALKSAHSFSALEEAAKKAGDCRGFASRMKEVSDNGDNALICEIKRRSPSAGLISALGDPLGTAKAYQAGGAACISVLTDGPSFGGSPDDLMKIRASVDVPVLRKDFMIDVFQVFEARAMGADAILIIMASSDDMLANELHAVADDLGMSVLIEVHDEAELERALNLPSPLIGVNNRDLKTFTTDLSVTERLAIKIPKDRVLVAESGIKTEKDVVRLRGCGAKGFLVGESLMRADKTSSSVESLVKAR